MASPRSFEIERTDGGARAGTLQTAHGAIRTPVFMPVGTRATVKGLTPADLINAGAQVVLANTYHLTLRPGEELIESFGGLHGFMAWDRPILTDSGGFQVFSLADLKKVDDDGVAFRSHIDGDLLRLTPEGVVEIQRRLGSDLIMPLDECVPYPCEPERVRIACDRTIRWAERSLQAHKSDGQLLFAIVQGGMNPALRAECAQALAAMDFSGYAIGGLSVGEEQALMLDTLAVTTPHLPADRPHYLMGVGTPVDMMEAVARGVDMFDCVMPTRNARNGMAFTSAGKVKITRKEFRASDEPLDAACGCYTCRTFSRGYLRHLAAVGEYLAVPALTLHNVTFYNHLLAGARDAILGGTFKAYRKHVKEAYEEDREGRAARGDRPSAEKNL